MKIPMWRAAVIAALLFMPMPAGAASVIKHVIVIAMENTDAKEIYGNVKRAPYINGTLMPNYARATDFNDPLGLNVPSEPHYIWMEAGTNVFADHAFTTNRDPKPKKGRNSTASGDHLVRQIKDSGTATWMSYQEGITSGQCPIVSFGLYGAKHNPFVFFEDVSGSPPSKKTQYCIDHHKPYSAFAADLAANNLANYVFITPNLCNDMHGDKKCPKGHRITAGDNWLKAELPRMIDWVTKNSGVIFIIWDEGNETLKLPFFAIGPGVKANHTGAVTYNHGSLIRSVEEIFNLPILATVQGSSNFADLFRDGQYP
jgi:phosphatidylinositol-3-phosphatase